MSESGTNAGDNQVVVLRSAEIIDHEAAAWLTKLDRGELNSADREKLKIWLAQDAAHVTALDDMASMWRDMDFVLNDLPELEASRFSFFDLISIKPPVIAAMATIFCAVLVAMWSNPFFHKEQMVYYTDIGHQMTQHLSDGSSAKLNTNSVIEIEYTRNKRIVRLMRGEALFDVAHDPSRPFIVYVGEQAVKAVGTAFVVKIESEKIQVTVTEGQVQLSQREDMTASNDLQHSAEAILITSDLRTWLRKLAVIFRIASLLKMSI